METFAEAISDGVWNLGQPRGNSLSSRSCPEVPAALVDTMAASAAHEVVPVFVSGLHLWRLCSACGRQREAAQMCICQDVVRRHCFVDVLSLMQADAISRGKPGNLLFNN